jgi:VanZ family protein
VGRIFLIAILLIVYGSLYPFHFEVRHLAASPVWLLFHSWPSAMERSVWVDAAVNVLIYLPLGFFGGLCIGRWKALLLGCSLSAAIEMLQLYDFSRTCSSLDLVTNTAGTAAGICLVHLYGRKMKRLRMESAVRSSLRPSPALLLLCFWIAALSFPFIPHLRLSPLRAKVALLLHPSFALLETITAVFAWLAVARLLEEIRLGRTGLALMMLLVPAKLLVANRTFTWSELAGAGCAWILWSAWLLRNNRRSWLLAWMAVAVLLVRGLAPFYWQNPASPFSWTPFAGFFETDKTSAAMIFFNKSFLYGTVVWFFAQVGCPLLVAGLGVAGLLGLIEVVQTHLPGRTPEITDPFYTLVLATVLKFLEAADRHRPPASQRTGSVRM